MGLNRVESGMPGAWICASLGVSSPKSVSSKLLLGLLEAVTSHWLNEPWWTIGDGDIVVLLGVLVASGNPRGWIAPPISFTCTSVDGPLSWFLSPVKPREAAKMPSRSLVGSKPTRMVLGMSRDGLWQRCQDRIVANSKRLEAGASPIATQYKPVPLVDSNVPTCSGKFGPFQMPPSPMKGNAWKSSKEA
ncbi:uncharacterized protein ACIB01_019447 [Guaruba guarouba]